MEDQVTGVDIRRLFAIVLLNSWVTRRILSEVFPYERFVVSLEDPLY